MLQAYYKDTNVKVRTSEKIRTTSGKIIVNNDMEYYAHIFKIKVREYDEYEEKYIFVTEELTTTNIVAP